MIGSRNWPWAILLTLWASAFALACRLTAARPDPDAGSASVAEALLGESRAALSASLYETADDYFHRGIEHKRRRTLQNSVFRVAHREVSPNRHVHLQGEEVREILPWLRAAARLDPRNVEVYLVTAYWLAGDLRRPDLALEVLREAQANNPASYEVHLEKGRVLLRMGERAGAARELDAGLAVWPGTQDRSGEDARLGRQSLLLHRALLYEAEGRSQDSVRLLKEILAMFPQRRHIRERLDSLSTGAAPAVPAENVLQSLLREGDRDRQICTEEAEPHA